MLASMAHVVNFDQTFIPVLYDDQNLVGFSESENNVNPFDHK